MADFARLEKALRAAGIPIEGGTLGPPVRIDFTTRLDKDGLPEYVATEEQRAQAYALAEAFDKRPRKTKDSATLASEIQALPGGDRSRLRAAIDDEIRARFLQANPDFAKALGIDLEGDEPVSR